MNPHAVIKVQFFTAAEGGREKPIVAASYGCPILAAGKGFDCRFVLDREKAFPPGQLHLIEVSFLSPGEARHSLHRGQEIELWEGKVIARGVIQEIFSE